MDLAFMLFYITFTLWSKFFFFTILSIRRWIYSEPVQTLVYDQKLECTDICKNVLPVFPYITYEWT